MSRGHISTHDERIGTLLRTNPTVQRLAARYEASHPEAARSLAARRQATRCLAALASLLMLSFATAAASHAAEFSGIDNPNNYECHGHTQEGTPELGAEEPSVQYQFACDGPITGYQIESQVELTGIEASPIVTYYLKNEPLTDTFSCGGELPGWAVNCVGATKGRGELITGQFSIGSPVCAEPRANPLLTVTYAYIEKEVVTQAISGPFELGRPKGCKPDAFEKDARLAPPTPLVEPLTDKGKHKKHKHKKGRHKGSKNSHGAAKDKGRKS